MGRNLWFYEKTNPSKLKPACSISRIDNENLLEKSFKGRASKL